MASSVVLAVGIVALRSAALPVPVYPTGSALTEHKFSLSHKPLTDARALPVGWRGIQFPTETTPAAIASGGERP
jgi:hypothetical protein